MTELFLKVVNMSITAGILAVVVMLLRLILKKAPRWMHVLLWGLVAVRLMIPVPFESSFSLMPQTQWIEQEPVSTADIPQETIPAAVVSENTAEVSYPAAEPEIQTKVSAAFVLSCIWLAGMTGLLLYAGFSYVRVYRRVQTAFRITDNIWWSPEIPSPFVFGIFRPKIYLPLGITEEHRRYVIAHEKAHIRRHDHWWKPLGFLLLTIHWFNPVLWLAYILLCRDIEMACDERVVKEYDMEKRADYSAALLRCSVKRSMISACPLAFGEADVKTRIKAVLNYRKPAVWVIGIAVILCVGTAVCFLTNPVENRTFLREIEMETAAVDMESAEACISEPPYQGIIDDPFWSFSEKTAYHFYGTAKGEMVYTARHFVDSEYEWAYISKLYNTHKANNPSSDSFFTIPNSMLPLVPFIISIENEGAVPLRLVIYGSSDGKKIESHTVAAGESTTLRLETDRYWYMGFESVGFTDEPVSFRGSIQGPNSSTHTSVPQNETTLTLDDVIRLSEKGESLTWEDFAGYKFIETGSGIYIRVYEIDETFDLIIGDGDFTHFRDDGTMTGTPWYIRLCADHWENYADVTKDDVAAFIAEHQELLFGTPIDWFYDTAWERAQQTSEEHGLNLVKETKSIFYSENGEYVGVEFYDADHIKHSRIAFFRDESGKYTTEPIGKSAGSETIQTILSFTDGQLIFDNTVVSNVKPAAVCEYRYIPVPVSDTMRENLFEAYFGERADDVFCKDEQKDVWQLGETMSGVFYQYNTVPHVSGASVFTVRYSVPNLIPFDDNRKGSGEPSGCTITAEEAAALCEPLLGSMTDITRYKIDYAHHYGNNGENPFYWICYKRILDGLTVNAFKDIYFFVDDNGVEEINGAFYDTEKTEEYTDYLTAEEAVDALAEQLDEVNWKKAGTSEVARIGLEYVTVKDSSGRITIVPIWRMELGNSEEERILNRNRILGIHAGTGELVQDFIGMGNYN